ASLLRLRQSRLLLLPAWACGSDKSSGCAFHPSHSDGGSLWACCCLECTWLRARFSDARHVSDREHCTPCALSRGNQSDQIAADSSRPFGYPVNLFQSGLHASSL